MVSRDVACYSALDLVPPQTFRGPRESMVNNTQFVEAVRIPAQHVGLYFIDRVPSWSSPQAVDRLTTGSSVDLRCPSDMEFGSGFKFLNSPKVVIDISAANPELRITLEVCETSFKVILGQSQVPVELHN